LNKICTTYSFLNIINLIGFCLYSFSRGKFQTGINKNLLKTAMNLEDLFNLALLSIRQNNVKISIIILLVILLKLKQDRKILWNKYGNS
jgi:hypothetical protein